MFFDRAATTPDAKLPTWRAALETVAGIGHRLLFPGHGPVEAGRRGIDQARRWLDTVEEQVDGGFERGLDITDVMAVSLPDWTAAIAVARCEYARSVMHLMPALERERLPDRERARP